MLIGLAGFARAGKDTVGRGLTEQYGFTRFAFADALRREVDERYGLPRPVDVAKDQPWTPDGRTYRDALIEHGQAQRDHNPDYWVDVLDHDVAIAAAANVVITDVRFGNECRWVRAHGGVLVWVWRHGVVSNGSGTEQDRSAECELRIENDWSAPADLAARLILMVRGRSALHATGHTLCCEPLSA